MLSIRPHFWMGVNDIALEGNWIWMDGERASSSELIWRSGEPNNIGGNEDCVAVVGIGEPRTVGLAWDEICTRKHPALCEKPL